MPRPAPGCRIDSCRSEPGLVRRRPKLTTTIDMLEPDTPSRPPERGRPPEGSDAVVPQMDSVDRVPLVLILMVVNMTTDHQVRLGGAAEVASELGVSRQRLSKLRTRPDFPAPIAEISAGPVWDMDAIRRWNESGLRRPPGRPDRDKPTVLGGRFRLERSIGKGAFADVYRALDLQQDGTAVAVKILRDGGDEEVRRRFQRELRLVQSLDHPNVVSVLAHGVDTAGAWYAMPLASGSLAEAGQELIGNEMAIFDVIRQLGMGLAYVHSQGIFHRDLKSANSLRFGGDIWAIADFGLAREEERQTSALTSTLRQGFGTYHFAAPEQWQAAKYAGELADIYSLGKVLHALWTGEVPAYGSELPDGIYRGVIYRATRPRPADRFQTVDEFLDGLRLAVEVSRGQWETTAEAWDRLRIRLAAPTPDDASLRDLLELASRSDLGNTIRTSLTSILPNLSDAAVVRLWVLDADGFRSAFERFAAYASMADLKATDCDAIVGFIDRAAKATGDDAVLRAAVPALAELGHRNNRWLARDVLVAMLQQVRSSVPAMAVLDGLRQASPEALRWSLTEFAVRSLQPVLRDELNDLLAQARS
jgi:serine/threonine protein kinase